MKPTYCAATTIYFTTIFALQDTCSLFTIATMRALIILCHFTLLIVYNSTSFGPPDAKQTTASRLLLSSFVFSMSIFSKPLRFSTNSKRYEPLSIDACIHLPVVFNFFNLIYYKPEAFASTLYAFYGTTHTFGVYLATSGIL